MDQEIATLDIIVLNNYFHFLAVGTKVSGDAVSVVRFNRLASHFITVSILVGVN